MSDIIFFNVDTQKDFMSRYGALYVEDAELIKPQLKILTEYAAKHNIRVVNTADYHTDKSAEISGTPNFKSTFPEHCMIATEGSEFIDETNPKKFDDNYYLVRYTDSQIEEERFNRVRNIIILKDAFDVFEGNHLSVIVLSLLQPKKVIVYGVATDICVNFAILGLLKRNYKVYAVIDAMKGLPNARCENIFIDWLDKSATLLTVKQLVETII